MIHGKRNLIHVTKYQTFIVKFHDPTEFRQPNHNPSGNVAQPQNPGNMAQPQQQRRQESSYNKHQGGKHRHGAKINIEKDSHEARE